MKQKEGESITHFLARLRTLVKFCEFSVICPKKPDCGRHVDYSNDMVAGQIVAGLTHTDHQTKILAEATTLVTLQQKFDRLVGLEMTDHSTPHFNSTMHHTTVVNVQRSDRKKQSQEVKISPTPQYVQPCRECRRVNKLQGLSRIQDGML